VRRATAFRLGLIALLVAGAACSLAENYPDPGGPRFAGDYVTETPVAGPALRAVTYNLEYGDEVSTAIAALQQEPLAHADILFMQEMDGAGVEQIAQALGLRYVFYPASVQRDGNDFGNAILTRWPIVADRKLLLPHFDPYNHRARIAVLSVLDIDGRQVSAATVHTATISTGLGARLDQVDTLLEALEDAPDLRLVGGDFNTVDPSSLEQTVGLFEQRGYDWASQGNGPTTDTPWGDFTIDLFFSQGLRAVNRGVFPGDSGSDHQPAWVELAWPP
jgi:endonuclease/exonuclease/phosphatase family metal-dependent hydrolase